MSKYDNNFFDAQDLIEALNRGCEIEFLYKRKKYSITHTDDGKVIVGEFNNQESVILYSEVKQVLEYDIDDKKLKDIISEMKIIDRSF